MNYPEQPYFGICGIFCSNIDLDSCLRSSPGFLDRFPSPEPSIPLFSGPVYGTLLKPYCNPNSEDNNGDGFFVLRFPWSFTGSHLLFSSHTDKSNTFLREVE